MMGLVGKLELAGYRQAGACGLAFALAAAVLCPSGAAAAEIAPHQAIYRLDIASSSPTSKFNGLDGAAVSVIERTCEGWEINEQIAMTMLTVAGGAIQREMTYKARESNNGRTFIFESKSITNGNPEKFSGSARRNGGGAAEAEFINPRPFEMPLPDGTLFYIGMTKWLVDLASSGKRTGETFAFDGTDDEGAQKVTAFILPDKGQPELPGDASLLSGKAWQVRLGFFELKGQETAPSYEISLRILENGVITRFKLLFDDLVVDQVLEDLLPAKDERCS